MQPNRLRTAQRRRLDLAGPLEHVSGYRREGHSVQQYFRRRRITDMKPGDLFKVGAATAELVTKGKDRSLIRIGQSDNLQSIDNHTVVEKIEARDEMKSNFPGGAPPSIGSLKVGDDAQIDIKVALYPLSKYRAKSIKRGTKGKVVGIDIDGVQMKFPGVEDVQLYRHDLVKPVGGKSVPFGTKPKLTSSAPKGLQDVLPGGAPSARPTPTQKVIASGHRHKKGDIVTVTHADGYTRSGTVTGLTRDRQHVHVRTPRGAGKFHHSDVTPGDQTVVTPVERPKSPPVGTTVTPPHTQNVLNKNTIKAATPAVAGEKDVPIWRIPVGSLVNNAGEQGAGIRDKRTGQPRSRKVGTPVDNGGGDIVGKYHDGVQWDYVGPNTTFDVVALPGWERGEERPGKIHGAWRKHTSSALDAGTPTQSRPKGPPPNIPIDTNLHPRGEDDPNLEYEWDAIDSDLNDAARYHGIKKVDDEKLRGQAHLYAGVWQKSATDAELKRVAGALLESYQNEYDTGDADYGRGEIRRERLAEILRELNSRAGGADYAFSPLPEGAKVTQLPPGRSTTAESARRRARKMAPTGKAFQARSVTKPHQHHLLTKVRDEDVGPGREVNKGDKVVVNGKEGEVTGFTRDRTHVHVRHADGAGKHPVENVQHADGGPISVGAPARGGGGGGGSVSKWRDRVMAKNDPANTPELKEMEQRLYDNGFTFDRGSRSWLQLNPHAPDVMRVRRNPDGSATITREDRRSKRIIDGPYRVGRGGTIDWLLSREGGRSFFSAPDAQERIDAYEESGGTGTEHRPSPGDPFQEFPPVNFGLREKISLRDLERALEFKREAHRSAVRTGDVAAAKSIQDEIDQIEEQIDKRKPLREKRRARAKQRHEKGTEVRGVKYERVVGMSEDRLSLAQERREMKLLDQEIDRRLDEFIALSAKTVGPHARYKLRNLLKYYAKKPHPFRACVRDNRKRFGPGTEAVCATLKDIIRGTTKWRKGGKSDRGSKGLKSIPKHMAAADVVDLLLSIPDAELEALYNAELELQEYGDGADTGVTGEDSVTGNTTGEMPAEANWRPAEPGGDSCADCVFFDNDYCDHYGAPTDADHVSDAFEVSADDQEATATPEEAPALAEFHLEGELLLDEGGGDQEKGVWKTVLRTGVWKTRPGPGGKILKRPLVVTLDGPTKKGQVALKDLVDAFDDGAVEHVTIPLSHKDAVDENTGLIKKLRIVREDDGKARLDALHDFSDPGIAEKVKNRSILNTSCGILFDHIRKRDGKKYGMALGHVALTNKPWIDGMEPFGSELAASEDAQLETVHVTLDPDEDPDNLDEAGKDRDTTTTEEVNEEVNAEEITALTERMGLSMEDLAERLVRTEELEKNLRERDVNDLAKSWQADGVPPAVVDQAVAYMLADDGGLALLLSDDDGGSSFTVSQIVEGIVSKVPRLDLSDRTPDRDASDGARPNDDKDGEELSQEQKTENATAFLEGREPVQLTT